MELVFWQNILAIHQSAHIRALSDMGHSVTLVVAEELSEDRRQMGWSVPDFGGVRVAVAPNGDTIRDIVRSSSDDSVHIFGGARGLGLGQIATCECIKAKRRIGLLTEGGDPRGVKGFLRRAKYASEYMRIGGHYDFLLTMGENGAKWFTQCGYPESKVFPYAYLTERADILPSASSDDSSYRVIYVGQLIPRKHVDLLINAMGSLKELRWLLHIVGDGTKKNALRELTSSNAIADRVTWHGNLSNSLAASEISNADLLILPSWFDGWGAVVNEALMLGVPTICTDMCGARDLLRDGWRGTVVKSSSLSALTEALHKWIEHGKRTEEQTQRIADWSKCIDGESAAKYMLAVLGHVYGESPRPTPPWY